MDAAERRNAPLAIAGIALYVLGLPLTWPLDVARRGFCRRRHLALRGRLCGQTGVDEVTRGEVACATISTRVTSTLASGAEEETCVLLALRDGTERVVAWSRDLQHAIDEQGVRTVRREMSELGLASLFGWGAWLVVCLVGVGVWAGSWAPVVAAATVLVALVALGFS